MYFKNISKIIISILLITFTANSFAMNVCLSPTSIIKENTNAQNFQDEDKIIEINMKRVLAEARKILEVWRKDLIRIEPKDLGNRSISDYYLWSRYLKWTYYIIQNLPFSVEYGPHLKEVSVIYSELNLLLNQTYNLAAKYMENAKDVENKTQTLLILSTMNEYLAYIGDIIVAIESLSFIKIFSGYVLPAYHYFEKLFIGPIIRFFWGMSVNSFLVRKQLEIVVTNIISKGNNIVYQMYPRSLNKVLNNPGLSKTGKGKEILKILGFETYIDNLLTGKTIILKSEIVWIMRKQISRLLALVMGFIPIGIILYNNSDNNLSSFVVEQALDSFIKGVGLSMLISILATLWWFSTTFFLQLKSYITLFARNKKIRKPKEFLKSRHDFSENDLFNVSFENNWKIFMEELHAKTPSTDIIIILTGPDTTRVPYISDIILKSSYFRKDVPLIFLPNCKWGSGWAFLNIFNYLQSKKPALSIVEKVLNDPSIAKFNSHLTAGINNYIHLNGKNTEDLRILAIMTGEPDIDSVVTPLTLPIKDKRDLKPFEIGFLNGYLASHNLKEKNKTGITMINGALGYLGPVESYGDITISSVLQNKKSIAENELGLVYEDISTGMIRKILRYPVQEVISRKNTLANFGPIIISFFEKEKARFIETIDFFYSIKELLGSENQPLPIRFISDIIVPFVILSSKPKTNTPTISQRLASYFIIRIEEHLDTLPIPSSNRASVREFYFSLLDHLREKFPELKSPYSIMSNTPFKGLVRTITRKDQFCKRAA